MGWLGAASLIISAVGVGVSAVSSHNQAIFARQQAKTQSNMAYQAAMMQSQAQSDSHDINMEIAEMNEARALEQGEMALQASNEAAQKKRMQAQAIISSQRSSAGASGATVDQGSFLDLQLDTVEKGELDALAIQEKGIWDNYNKQIESKSYITQALGTLSQSSGTLAQGAMQSSLYNQQANSYVPWLDAGSALITGGSNFFKQYNTLYPTSAKP